MMIKKQLGVLAGSVFLASSVSAAIVVGDGDTGGSSAVLVLGNATGSYVIDTGLTADQLALGQGFSVDITAAQAALGGTVDVFALFGQVSGAGNAYSYTSFTYASDGLGIVYAQSSAGSLVTDAQMDGAITNLNAYLVNVLGGGFFADGTPGDLVGTSLGTTLFTVGLENGGATIAGLFLQTQDADGVSSQSSVNILNPAASTYGVYVDGTSFNVTSLGGTVVPVPAAAWLFGSALLGLGVVRRKK